MQGVPDRHSYRASRGKATLSRVTFEEIAAVVGVRRNSKKLRAMLNEERTGDDPNCVTAALLLLKVEHERIDTPFELSSYESVATIFWHAYAKLDRAIEFVGDPAIVARIRKSSGSRARLADQLTGHPGVHRYLYRGPSGSLRTALDRDSLRRSNCEPTSIIDLEELAAQLHCRLSRPLVTLRLNEPRRAPVLAELTDVGSTPRLLAA